MAVKKIIKDSFEQVFETAKDMAKSSAKQVAETLSPWDMIRNSFTETPLRPSESEGSERQGKSKKHTPLNFDNLKKSYENQDQKKIESMKLRLFQMVKKDEEKSVQRSQQTKAKKEQAISQEEAEKRGREEERRRKALLSNVPEGKSERGTALLGKKKKRQASEPQPAETKPGGGKQ